MLKTAIIDGLLIGLLWFALAMGLGLVGIGLEKLAKYLKKRKRNKKYD